MSCFSLSAAELLAPYSSIYKMTKDIIRNRLLKLDLSKKLYNHRGGSRINFRVLQNFTKKNEHRNDVICRKIIDSARSKKVQF